MIKAQATVECVTFRSGQKAKHLFSVHVSDPSHAFVRDYKILADSENDAAQRGIEMFCTELDPGPVGVKPN